MPQTIGPTRHSLTLTPVIYVSSRAVESHFDIKISYRESVVLPPAWCLLSAHSAIRLTCLFFILDSPVLNCDLEQTSRLLQTKFVLVAGKWRRARFFERLEERVAQIEPLWESALADVVLGELALFDDAVAAIQRRLRRLPR